MFWYGHDMNGWGYGLMGISMLAFWVLLIGAVAMVLRHNRNPVVHTGDVVAALTADQLLAQRFARARSTTTTTWPGRRRYAPTSSRERRRVLPQLRVEVISVKQARFGTGDHAGQRQSARVRWMLSGVPDHWAHQTGWHRVSDCDSIQTRTAAEQTVNDPEGRPFGRGLERFPDDSHSRSRCA